MASQVNQPVDLKVNQPITKISPRSAWTSNVPNRTTGPVPDPKGVIVHYVGGKGSLMSADPYELMERLRRYDMETRGYSDLQYSLAVPINRREVISGRGVFKKPASNGPEFNNTHISILVLGNINDGVDPKTLEIVARNVTDATRLVRDIYPGANEVLNHLDVRKTLCPNNFKIVKDAVIRRLADPEEIPEEEPIKELPSVFDCGLPNTILHTGLRNQDVGQLIDLLSFYGWYSFKNDYFYGPETYKAVMRLQTYLQERSLYSGQVDGRFNEETREGWCKDLEELFRLASA